MIPSMISVEPMYRTAAISVPDMTAIGTVFFGFSTAPVLAQADSRPRNAHSVTAMEADRPWTKL